MGVIIGRFTKKELVIEKIVTKEIKVCKSNTSENIYDKKDEINLAKKSCVNELNRIQELYGKAFNLFLASVGYQLTNVQQDKLESVINTPEKFIKEDQGSSASALITSNKSEILYEENIIDLSELRMQDNKKLTDSIEKFKLQDPNKFFYTSSFVSSAKRILSLNGQYNGQLYLVAGKDKGKVHDVELFIQYEKKSESKNKVLGNYQLKLIRDGEVYSDNKGRGGNRNIRENLNSLILDASPDSYIHFHSNQFEIGNYYDEGILVGVVKLRSI